MITISLCMIVKNEEDVLARCLESVGTIADEIIIVDTGSEDKTKEIACQFTKNVIDFPWIDDFAAARNYSFSKASMQYCMWLDADDILLEEDKNALLEFKKNANPDFDIAMLKYHTAFDEENKPVFSYYRERIIKNHKGYLWVGAVHEVISLTGKLIYSDIAVTHQKVHPSDPDRNLKIFEKLLKEGKELDPRQQFYYGRELYYHNRCEEAIAVFQDFLQKGRGWIENEIDACKQMAYCYYYLKNEREALASLFRSFLYDKPRAEVCCEIGKHFMDRKNYTTAIFWYEIALACNRNDVSGGFISPDCYGFIPNIQLAVCYDKLMQYEKANKYNEKAGDYKPSSSAYLANKEYFKKRLEA